MRRPGRGAEWAVVGLITLGAAILRLYKIAEVPGDPFYDAAVRSMGLSWHNFFFGAFEPGGSVSIDKPPVDLWLQVISTKVLGYSRTSLRLPEALAGIAAVPLIYESMRRLWSGVAGIAAAAALAVLPVEVITSRSDTMDGVMMMLLVLALLLVARALETGGTGWLLAGAAVLGIAFDVKLLESIVALPGLALLALLGMPGRPRRRALQLAGATAVYVVVALAWLTATLLAPASDRPYAIGSTDGSAWNAAFVFNGTDRLSSKSPEPQGTVYEPGHVYPTATQSERDHIPIIPPSPTRLFTTVGPLSGERLGMELLIGLLLGIPAMILGVRGPPARAQRRREQPVPVGVAAGAVPAEQEPPEAGTGGTAEPRPAPDAPGARAPAPTAAGEPHVPELRIRRAAAAGLGLWLLTGYVLFSHMARLHPRYVEGFVPAVVAFLGVGMAWACAPRGRLRLAALAVAMAVTVYYSERLMYGFTATVWIVLACALGALALALAGRAATRRGSGWRWPLGAGTLTLALAAVLAVGLGADITSIENKVSDAGFVGQLPGGEQAALVAYVDAHNHGARYQIAAESATQIGSLIVQEAKPVVILTTYDARVYTSVAKLQHLIAEGKVRYALLTTTCGHKASSVNAACSAPVLWIRAHGTDVSRQANMPRGGVLWLLPGARP